jgi:hypothetical protein
MMMEQRPPSPTQSPSHGELSDDNNKVGASRDSAAWEEVDVHH